MCCTDMADLVDFGALEVALGGMGRSISQIGSGIHIKHIDVLGPSIL